MFSLKKTRCAFALVLIAMLAGCGGKKVKKQPSSDELACIDMPVGLHDEQGQTFVFDQDIEAFVLDEEHDAGQFNRTVALKDQELDFAWDELENAEEKVVVFYPYDGRDPRNDQAENLAKADATAREIYERGGKLAICGHSCKWHGTAAYNLALSQDRPHALQKHFVEDLGIPASHIKTFGVGNNEPIAFEFTKEGQAPNRRVEVYELRA